MKISATAASSSSSVPRMDPPWTKREGIMPFFLYVLALKTELVDGPAPEPSKIYQSVLCELNVPFQLGYSQKKLIRVRGIRSGQ